MVKLIGKWFWQIFFITGLVLSPPIWTQQSNHSRLKDFLNHQDFLQLIQKYKMDTISLQWEGTIRDSLARLNYLMQPGFRCQVFAGSIQKNAQHIFNQLQSANFSPLYLIHTTDGLYKVQVGDFQVRAAAENMMLKLFKAGFTNVWLVRTRVRVPREHLPIQSRTEETIHRSSLNKILYYGVQILATGDSTRALRLKSDLQNKFSYPITILQKDRFFKLIIGKFEDKTPAERLLKTLRKKGFEDAWITQIQ